MRIGVVSMGMLWLTGCGLLGTPTTPTAGPGEATPPPQEEEDPAANEPICRPEGADPARGEVPFATGQAFVEGWTITGLDTENHEFIRLTLEGEGTTTGLEIAFQDGSPDDWSTEHYRLMPAPDTEPPEALLTAAMAKVKELEAGLDGTPFVVKRGGTDDPYDGLPPCGPDGKPVLDPEAEAEAAPTEAEAAPTEAAEAPAEDGTPTEAAPTEGEAAEGEAAHE